MQNPDRSCPHQTFHADVTVNRVGEQDPGADGAPRGYMCDVTVGCADCGEPFRFTGLTSGLSFAHPTVNVTEQTLHAPIRPASADPDFGLGLPGFSIKAVYP